MERTGHRNHGFPDAELKIFVTATPEIRAQRRFDELKAKAGRQFRGNS